LSNYGDFISHMHRAEVNVESVISRHALGAGRQMLEALIAGVDGPRVLARVRRRPDARQIRCSDRQATRRFAPWPATESHTCGLSDGSPAARSQCWYARATAHLIRYRLRQAGR
jgi:hypothetical protein